MTTGYARPHPGRRLLTQRFLALVKRNSEGTIQTERLPVNRWTDILDELPDKG